MAPVGEGSRGLEGVTAALSAVSSIMGDTLTYRGYAIDELARQSTFEEVSYLLWHGELPTVSQHQRFSGDLRAHRLLPPEVAGMIRELPADANTMVALRTAVSALALYDPLAEDNSEQANKQKAVSLLAKLPTIVASMHRMRLGMRPIPPDPELDEASNFLVMMRNEPPDPDRARILNTALILHADHELNASTFAARVAASTLADLHSAVVAGLSTLKGSLHGGANEGVMRMLEEIGEEANVTPYLDSALQDRGRIMGFGHRVYVAGDPRARVLKALSAELAEETRDFRWYSLSCALEERMRQKTGLLPNVDFYSASVYTYMGIPRYLFTPLFAMSRVSGWIAHILEQYDNNRLIRPRAEYVGVGPRSYVPLHER
jgi:citrate synthase